MDTRSSTLPALALCGALLGGCVSQVDDVHHYDTRSIGSSMTLLSSSSQIIITNADGTVCVGPPPDATADLGFSAGVSVFSGGGNDSAGGAEEEIPLGGRNPNVLVTRDILFQSCLAESRLDLNADERKAHFAATLQLVQQINAQSLEGEGVENDGYTDSEDFVAPGADD